MIKANEGICHRTEMKKKWADNMTLIGLDLIRLGFFFLDYIKARARHIVSQRLNSVDQECEVIVS